MNTSIINIIKRNFNPTFIEKNIGTKKFPEIQVRVILKTPTYVNKIDELLHSYSYIPNEKQAKMFRSFTKAKCYQTIYEDLYLYIKKHYGYTMSKEFKLVV